MRRALIAALLLLSASLAARAEDFSGFYAGVTAGYAAGQDREPVVGRPPPGTAARPGSDLPPSAVGAASALRPAGQAGASGSVAR